MSAKHAPARARQLPLSIRTFNSQFKKRRQEVENYISFEQAMSADIPCDLILLNAGTTTNIVVSGLLCEPVLTKQCLLNIHLFCRQYSTQYKPVQFPGLIITLRKS